MTAPARAGAGAEVARRVPDIETLRARLDEVDYLADDGLATALFLSVRLPQPLLLEGRPGWARRREPRRLPACSTRR